MNRHVIVVFFGAHYAAQEERYLYHSIDMSDKTVNPIDFYHSFRKISEGTRPLRNTSKWLTTKM